MLGDYISAERYRDLVASGRTLPDPWLHLDPGKMAASYNRSPFLVEHRLQAHPLFKLDALFALCRRLPRRQVVHRFGPTAIDADFDASFHVDRKGMTLEDAIAQFEERQAYIYIANPERDPEYRPVIEGLLAEMAAQTDAVDPCMTWYSTYVFISAQQSVTPYHADREMNFLLQVRGLKTVQLWDPADDTVLGQARKEHMFSSAADARPPYDASFAAKAMHYELRPGIGVHHPFLAPHLVQTGPELSISFALSFRTRQSDVWSDAYRVNQRLRRLGLRPTAVGAAPRLDAAKAGLFRAAKRTAGVLKRAE